MSSHSATSLEDEADTFAVLVSSLSTYPRIADHTADDGEIDSTMMDLLDHFAVLDDSRDQRWIEHPTAAVLTLCAAAVVAGMRSFTAIAGWVADTPPRLMHRLYQRCGKPALTPSKTTIWQVLTHTDAATADAAVGAWLAARANIDITPTPPTPLTTPTTPTCRLSSAAPPAAPNNSPTSEHPGRYSRSTANASVAPSTATATPPTCSPPPPTSRA